MGCLADSHEAKLDTYPLPLPPDRFAEVIHLGANHVVYGLASPIYIFAYAFRDVVDRDRFDHLLPAVAGGAIAASGTLRGQPRAVAPALGGPTRARCRAVARPARTLEAR